MTLLAVGAALVILAVAGAAFFAGMALVLLLVVTGRVQTSARRVEPQSHGS